MASPLRRIALVALPYKLISRAEYDSLREKLWAAERRIAELDGEGRSYKQMALARQALETEEDSLNLANVIAIATFAATVAMPFVVPEFERWQKTPEAPAPVVCEFNYGVYTVAESHGYPAWYPQRSTRDFAADFERMVDGSNARFDPTETIVQGKKTVSGTKSRTVHSETDPLKAGLNPNESRSASGEADVEHSPRVQATGQRSNPVDLDDILGRSEPSPYQPPGPPTDEQAVLDMEHNAQAQYDQLSADHWEDAEAQAERPVDKDAHVLTPPDGDEDTIVIPRSSTLDNP